MPQKHKEDSARLHTAFGLDPRHDFVRPESDPNKPCYHYRSLATSHSSQLPHSVHRVSRPEIRARNHCPTRSVKQLSNILHARPRPPPIAAFWRHELYAMTSQAMESKQTPSFWVRHMAINAIVRMVLAQQQCGSRINVRPLKSARKYFNQSTINASPLEKIPILERIWAACEVGSISIILNA